MDLNGFLQSRFRQTLGVRGGPLVSVSDFVQPTVSLGSAEGPYRNPALELGEGIKRQFIVQGAGSIVALNFGVVQLFTADASALIHVRRIGISVDGSTSRILVGRTTRVTSANLAGAAHGNYTDFRYPISALGSSGVMQTEEGATFTGVAPAYLGFLEFQPLINTTTYLDVDFPIVSPANQGGAFNGALVISAATSATAFRCSLEGELYNFGPGAR